MMKAEKKSTFLVEYNDQLYQILFKNQCIQHQLLDLLLRAARICSVNNINADMVDHDVRKPCWLLLNMFLTSKC